MWKDSTTIVGFEGGAGAVSLGLRQLWILEKAESTSLEHPEECSLADIFISVLRVLPVWGF
jgi:hypothetical protein